ncbi:hypothetical protein GDO78_020256 [Eleutherodactylus coqui]|uniref:Uncharacterized protein n=2 Tax=Eleutherodactylus coqui TaxID=57060 RepID=A0A8J6BFW2_ELECQ|nr:hypothetical protein GDO78_020256 [Eleutherodactylus coqui]
MLLLVQAAGTNRGDQKEDGRPHRQDQRRGAAAAEAEDAKRLGAETDEMKEQRKGLVQEEKETLAKLKGLEETEAKLQEEGVLTSAALFLRSEEAACAAKLFQEENRNAKDLLEELTERQTEVQNTYHRLKLSLEDAEKQQLEVSQAPPEKSQRATISDTIPFPCVQ